MTVFDNSLADNTQNEPSHGLTNLGHDKIVNRIFVYPDDDNVAVQHLKPTKFFVYEKNITNSNKLKFIVSKESNIASDDTTTKLAFYFFAFEHDDKYLTNIYLNKAANYSIVPAFNSVVYSYFLLVPSDIANMTILTNPVKDVTMIVDDPTHSMADQDSANHLLSQIFKKLVPNVKNRSSITFDEINKVLGPLANPDDTKKSDEMQDIASLWVNKSVSYFIDYYSRATDNHPGIIKLYDKMKNDIEGVSDTKKATLDAFGLLSDPWTPITMDFHYDLHHWRLFIARKAGQIDVARFAFAVKMRELTYKSEQQCPNIDPEALVVSDIDPQYDKIRVPLVACPTFVIMSLYICVSRWRYNTRLEKHKKRDLNENSTELENDELFVEEKVEHQDTNDNQ